MSEERQAPNQCPRCGRFTGEGWDDGVQASPGFWDSVLHIQGSCGCDEPAEQEEYAACFCDRRCADLYHGREVTR